MLHRDISLPTPRRGAFSARTAIPLLVLSLLVSVLTGLVTSSVPAQAATTPLTAVQISMADGTAIRGNVIAPEGTGPYPAVVFISSWGLGDAEYILQATAMAKAGYVVLSYAPRGFGSSGGEIDTAGPKDIADVSAVLDWLIAHTAADPARIGIGGISYGAGIGLIASAFDARIHAVAAMSGWSDLVASLYGNSTRRPQAARLLQVLAVVAGHPSAELTAMLSSYFANTDIAEVTAWARVRSAATYVDAINAHAPAILLANAYGDSLFPPNQLVSFYGRLSGPKRLELAPGDHVIAEATGLAGLPNSVWTSTRRWFAHYLAGEANGIDTEQPIVLTVRGGSSATESAATWDAVSTQTQRLGLGATSWVTLTGPLGGTPATGWSTSIGTGLDTVADGGIVLLTGALEALTGEPPVAWIPAVNRLVAGVWAGSGLTTPLRIRGIGDVHLTVRPSAATGTVIAYLYDVDALGTGTLVTHVPVSWSGATPGAGLTLDAQFPATAWDVPAGHHLSLVVDTADPLYIAENPAGATLAFTGPSWVDVPSR